jgi:catechol 2,3-dioxygenase-like lactoylglutathione lyase family enzyme
MLEDHIRLKSINHTTYNVRDKEAALKWYQEVLGLKQIPKMVNSENLYWLQLPSGAMVHIIVAPRRLSSRRHRSGARGVEGQGRRDDGDPDPQRRATGLLPARPRRQSHRDLHPIRLWRPGLIRSSAPGLLFGLAFEQFAPKIFNLLSAGF